MSSIAGIITFDPAANPRERMERMRPWLGCGLKGQRCHTAISGGGGMLRMAPVYGLDDPAEAVGQEQDVVAAFIGQPLIDPSVRDNQNPAGTNGHGGSDSISSGRKASPSWLCRMYRSRGTGFIEHLQGSFSLALWDARERRLILATDRLGTRPIYYGRAGSRVVFATDARALLADEDLPREMDEQTLCEYLALGFPLEDRTLLKGIRLVEPGSMVTLTAGGVMRSTYYQARFETGPAGGEPLDRAFCDRFLTAIRELTEEDGTYAVPLSGGLDSRCIAAALWRCGRKAESFTIGIEGAEDLRLARVVAERLGFAHRAWRITPDDFLGWVEEGVRLTDGTFNAFDTHILFVARQLPADTRAVFDGISCSDSLYSLFEVLMGRVAPARMSRRLADRLYIQPMVHPDRVAFAPDGLFSGDFRRAAEGHVVNSLADVAGTNGEGPLFDRFDCADLRQRIRRYNFVGSVILNAYAPVHCPFFHPGVFEVALQLPPSLRVKEKPMERRLVQYLAPQLNDIPWERTNLSPAAGPLRILARYGERKLRGLGHKIMSAAFGNNGHAKRGVAIDYGRWLRESERMQVFVRDVLLSTACLERGYFDKNALRSLVENHIRGRGGQMALIGRLISVELWHRMFLDRTPVPAVA